MITNDRQNHTPNSACIIIYTLQQTGYFAYIISLYAIFAEVRTSNKGNKKILKIIESNKFKNMSFSNEHLCEVELLSALGKTQMSCSHNQ